MFQKLYKHLDEINSRLRDSVDNPRTSQFQEKILEQLLQLNDNIRLHEEHLLREKQKTRRYAALGIVLLFICTAALLAGQIHRLLPVDDTINRPVAFHTPSFDPAADSGENARNKENLQKLDTLVAQQSQSINELKLLNRNVLITLRRIRRHFSDQEKREHAAKQPGDSPVLHVAL